MSTTQTKKRLRTDDADVPTKSSKRPLNPPLAKPPATDSTTTQDLVKKFKTKRPTLGSKIAELGAKSKSRNPPSVPPDVVPSVSGEKDDLSALVASVKAKAIKAEAEDGSKEGQDGAVGETEVADDENEAVTFESLGIIPQICEACVQLNYKRPTQIQREAIPVALQGRDIIGLAQTGSGKTAAFGIPILQALWKDPKPFFALVLAPTRELALQISASIAALGSPIGARVACLVGGMDMMEQAVALARMPHVVVGTPGRVVDHLENTKGFRLGNLRMLVLDEADRLLDLDFGSEIDKVLAASPREGRTTFLFSATMTSKVEKLQRASLRDPVRVEVAGKYTTVATLLQYYMLIPFSHKETYLAHLLNAHAALPTIVFAATVITCQRLSLALRNLGFPVVALHGGLSQHKRLGALGKFKAGERGVLVATDVASRGLDIPSVDLVVNYDVPGTGKDYVHRVGRTARAGKGGLAVTFVTQYDIEWYQRIEAALNKKLPEFQHDKAEVMAMHERVSEAVRYANMQMKEEAMSGRHRKGGGQGDDDGEEAVGAMMKGGKSKFDRRGKGMGGGRAKSGGGRGRK
ncbi:DEAD-domain-containing protein [Gonapodya prolifera JEL478]|uniref:DEAD-domain-containing protein n=1 Tax=Gonapodya prolifera (strain JEL478) TaxID=1344416 RepID=A0A139A7Q2_GONPJ|nr:DEAD-domain-containing protein [Gonapodya prolifera JEL478]|eukprot:KXS12719.1 DEAD-domain-containing protein [Gonapodya prolifera JEL478]